MRRIGQACRRSERAPLANPKPLDLPHIHSGRVVQFGRKVLWSLIMLQTQGRVPSGLELFLDDALFKIVFRVEQQV